MSSHLDGEMVLAGEVNITDFVGNLLADIGAGIPTDGSGHAAESRYMEMWEARAFLVARRLAIIEAQIWQRGEMLVPEPAPREPCATPVEESVMNDTQLEVHERGHRLIKYGSGTKCTRCRVQQKVGGYRFWTTVDCRGADRKRTLATQVDEVGSDVDAVNTTRGSEPPDELGLGQVDPAGFDDPEGGEWQAAASGSMRTADRRQRMGQARTRGKVLDLSLSPSGGASCGSNATRLKGRKQPPRVSSAAPGPDSSRSYPSMQTGLGPTPTTSFPLRCTIATPACTAEDTSAAFGAVLSSRRIRTAPSVANVARFALLAQRGPSSGSFGAVYRGGKNGPMERSLHSPTSWTSLVRTAIAAARESLRTT